MKNFKFKLGGKDYETSVEEKDGNIVEVTVNGKAYSVELEQQAVKPAARPVARPTAAPSAAPAPAGGASKISAPLPGNITKIIAQAGQSVKKGDVLLTMEAMKMENNITSEYAGTVKAILVQQGASVMNGDALVEIG